MCSDPTKPTCERRLDDAREIKLGDRFDESVEVLEGLNAGEQVAITQLSRLDSGVKVRVTDTADNPRTSD